jgi:hypothetical protein
VGLIRAQREPLGHTRPQGIRNGVQLGVLVAPVLEEAGTKAAERSHSGKSAVLRHADNSGRRSRERISPPRSVFPKEDEAYHTEVSNLNAFHDMPLGITAQSGSHAILFPAMKLAIGIVVLFFIAASFFADYKWKQWMAARKQERDQQK